MYLHQFYSLEAQQMFKDKYILDSVAIIFQLTDSFSLATSLQDDRPSAQNAWGSKIQTKTHVFWFSNLLKTTNSHD